MLSDNTRRLFALLTAVLVVCSFVAMPAAGVGQTDGWDSGLDGSSSSTDTTDSEDTESSDSDSDTTDSSDSDSDDAESSDTGSEDGDTDAESENDTSSDSGDAASSSESESTSKVRDTINETTDTVEETTDSTTDAVEETAGADDTSTTLDGTTDTLGETTDSTTDAVEESIETLALEESATTLETVDRPEATYLRMATDSELQLDTDVETEETNTDTTRSSLQETGAADADDADDGSAVVMSTGANAGGQPLPSAPVGAGGAAVSLSLLAGMAALRSTPLVAGGLPSLGSIGAGISMPAILSKLRPFLFPLRYSRYDDSDPLEHEAREEVYEIVNDSPGSYLSELSQEADLPLSTTRHHIKVLEREDLVSGAKLRGKRRFYPAYAEGVELAAALNDEATAAIIDAIARLGAASVSDLADDIGRDPSTISHHLQRLEEDGIITREREGRAVMNKLSGEARTALEPDSTPKPGDAGSAIAGGAD